MLEQREKDNLLAICARAEPKTEPEESLLNLFELLIKINAGYRVSYTEGNFLNWFSFMYRKDK